MGKRHQVQMLLHGGIVLFIGLVYGLPFGAALPVDRGGESAQAWRVAHSGAVAMGVMVIAIGAALDRLVLRDRAVSLLVWSMVASAYAFSLALLLGAVPGVRGYQPTGPPLNLLAFVCNLIGVMGALLGVALLIRGASAALKGSNTE